MGAVKLQNVGAESTECGGENQDTASYGLWQWLDLQLRSLCRRVELILHQKIRGEN